MFLEELIKLIVDSLIRLRASLRRDSSGGEEGIFFRKRDRKGGRT